MQAKVRDASGQFSITAFKAPPDKSAPTEGVSPRTLRRVCTGEFEANCAGAHDVFYMCGYFGSDDEIAKKLCPDQPSRAIRLNTKGGNKCGYSLIEVTCG